MDQDAIDAVFDDPVARRLLEGTEVARLAYRALDGSPRAVPVGFVCRRPHFVVCTATNAAKVRALRADPRVALTIDTDEFRAKALLVRGRVALEVVDGVPEEYIDSTRKRATPDEHAEWETAVRELFDQMVRIVITPTWVKVLDSETRIPSAVEELAAKKAATDNRERPAPSASPRRGCRRCQCRLADSTNE